MENGHPCDIPSDGTEVRKGNSNKESKASSDQASHNSRARIDRSHTSDLKVKGGQVSKSENENGSPVPENGVWKGRQGKGVCHLRSKDTLIATGISSIVDSRAGGRIFRISAPLGGVVAASVGVLTVHTIIHGADFCVGVDISRETNRRRGSTFFCIGDEPVTANDAARPGFGIGEEVRVRKSAEFVT